jgi:hypothetical protein
MARDLIPPKKRPARGYYYHYKHDPAGPVNDYAYFIDGVGAHTEDDCEPEDKFFQIYRPLYEAWVYEHGKMYDVRPLHMHFEFVEHNGKKVPRFLRILDPAIIAELRAIKHKMYPAED